MEIPARSLRSHRVSCRNFMGKLSLWNKPLKSLVFRHEIPCAGAQIPLQGWVVSICPVMKEPKPAAHSPARGARLRAGLLSALAPAKELIPQLQCQHCDLSSAP